MKKILFLFTTMLLLMASCTNEDDFKNPSADTNTQQTRWYGVKNLKETQTRGVAQRDKLWSSGTVITVKFLNDPYGMAEQVQTYAKEWEQYANIRFEFVESSEKAHIRIGFDWNESRWVTWSYTGTDAKFIQNQHEATLNFALWDSATEAERKADVLRAFGQVLGLELEHRHLEFEAGWTSRIQDYWEGEIQDIAWSDLKEYVFEPIEARNLVQTKEYDEESIMIWPLNRKYATNTARDYNYELSESDKAFIATLYPKTTQNTLPTIQEAWVDAGYFRWTDETKTALRITELGAQQDTLPDVSDGEQLTSVANIFKLHNDTCTQLKKAPFFNTTNVTDFSDMFSYCTSLKSIPQLDTSKGTNFSRMFSYCRSLSSIPQLDTSKGTDFNRMFDGCSSLSSIPQLDTSKGTNFSSMFSDCSSLSSIPQLDTSKGTDFSSMVQGCINLTTIPFLDTSKGTFFAIMFYKCSSLRSIPQLDTSKGTYFSWMFSFCSSLTTIPQLDTSKGKYLQYMFYMCSALTSKPQLDLSNAQITNGMFYGTPFQ